MGDRKWKREDRYRNEDGEARFFIRKSLTLDERNWLDEAIAMSESERDGLERSWRRHGCF